MNPFRKRPSALRHASFGSLIITEPFNSVGMERNEDEEAAGEEATGLVSPDNHSVRTSISETPSGDTSHAVVSGPEQSISGTAMAPGESRKSSFVYWTPEMISLYVAIGCIVSLFTTLEQFNGQKQPHLQYEKVQNVVNLSTLVALLATLFRSMLENVLGSVVGQLKWRWFRSKPHSLNRLETYNDASRGSWGSFTLLFSYFHLYLATLGAMITVLSTVISIFAQQALQTVPCQNPTGHGIASVPIAQTLAPFGETGKVGGPEYQLGLSLNLKAALVAGLVGSKSPNHLSPECTSGNCTFQVTSKITYSSIGITSKCVDISPNIMQSGALSWDDQGNATHGNVTIYSLPHGVNISYRLTTDRWDTIDKWSEFLVRARSTGFSPEAKSEYRGEMGYRSLDPVVILMPTVSPCQNRSDYEDYLGDNGRRPMPPVNTTSCSQLNLPGVTTLPGFFSVVAAECLFYPSIQHYAGSVYNGVLTEEPIGDPIFLQNLHDAYVLEPSGEQMWCYGFSDPCIIDNVVYDNTSANISSVPGGLVTIDNATAPEKCLYGFRSEFDKVHFGGYEETLEGYEETFDFPKFIFGIAPTERCVSLYNFTALSCGTWWLNNIFNGGRETVESIDTFIGAGIKSYTNQLRAYGTDWDNNPLKAPGTVMETTVCKQFNWVWLVYPLAMLVGTLILFMAIFISSSGLFGGGVQETVWKSSVLPLLFYGLEAQYQRDDPKLATADELRKTAKGIKVNFSSRVGGWRLYAADKEEPSEKEGRGYDSYEETSD
ncbi:hypothetical protein PG990_011021 [Apiospora arundinis]